MKRFVRVLVLLMINTGCPKIAKLNGEHYNVDFQFKLCQMPYKCALRKKFVFPFVSNFSETPCVKIGFDVRIPSSDE